MSFGPCTGEFDGGPCRVCGVAKEIHPKVVAKNHHLLKDGVEIPFIDYSLCNKNHVHMACAAVIYHFDDDKELLEKISKCPNCGSSDVYVEFKGSALKLLSTHEEKRHCKGCGHTWKQIAPAVDPFYDTLTEKDINDSHNS